MPSKSQAQHRFMAKAMNDPGFAQAHGLSTDTAAEFVHADKGRVAKLPARKSPVSDAFTKHVRGPKKR